MNADPRFASERKPLAPIVGMLFLLAGPPTLLTTLAGWPLPSAADLHDAATLRWVSPTLAQQLGATVAWTVWLYIVTCIAVTVLAQVRRQTVQLLLPHVFATYINATVALLLVGTSVGGRHAALPPSPSVSIAAFQPPAPVVPISVPNPMYDVHPRDTLWDIAECELGNPLRWREIWQLNAHREMTDGIVFADPSLIRPGWRLKMPSQLASSHHVVHLPSMPTPHASPAAPLQPMTVQPPPAAIDPATTVASPEITTPSTTDHRPERVTSSEQDYSSTLPAGLGLGAAAAGIVTLLIRRRRTAMRRRPVGRRMPLPTDDLTLAERALKNSSNLDAAHALASTLRLASALALPTGEAILRVVVDRPEGIELQFQGEMSLPEPFQPCESGFLLPRDHLAATYAAQEHFDPAPALVHVGDDERGSVYLNLEALGAVALAGEGSALDGVAERLLLSLGSSPWTALAEVRLSEERLKQADLADKAEVVSLADELTRLTELTDRTRTAVQATGAQSLASLRWRQAEPPDGVSIVIASPEDPDIERLLTLALDPCSPVVAVLTGPRSDVASLQITDDGVILPDATQLRVTPVEPACVDAVRQLIDLTMAPFVDLDAEPYMEVHEQAPADDTQAELLVRVLGPVDIDGPVPHLSPQLRDIVLYLALHRRGVSLGEMATALWPEQLRSEKTLRNRMHELRRAIGGRVSLGPGWKFDDTVTTDWAKFQSWAKGNLDDRRRALELVRGQPLRDVKGDWSSLEGFASEMEASIVDLAIEVSEKLLAESEPVGAMAAARAGLLACPWEERLFQLAMRSAADRGAIGEVKTLYGELRAVLDIEVDTEPDPDTEATYQELLQAARRAASVS